MKNLIACLLLVGSLCVKAQNEDLNQYKYIIVDNQYEFQGEANEYHFNELIVFELEKRNIQAYRNSQVLPADLNIGACNSLRLKINKTGTLRVKMILELEDCQGNVIFTTKEGIGTTKSNKAAYFEALRDAMTSFDEVNYKYERPEYTKTLQNSEGRAMGIDSVLTQTGRPGEKAEEIKPQELPKFDKKVNDTKPAKTDKSDNDVPLPPEPEFIQLIDDVIYSDKSSSYFIALRQSKFYIYKNLIEVGYLKESKGGCFLAVTDEFTGIAYETKEVFFIEYTSNGIDKTLKLVRQ